MNCYEYECFAALVSERSAALGQKVLGAHVFCSASMAILVGCTITILLSFTGLSLVSRIHPLACANVHDHLMGLLLSMKQGGFARGSVSKSGKLFITTISDLAGPLNPIEVPLATCPFWLSMRQ